MRTATRRQGSEYQSIGASVPAAVTGHGSAGEATDRQTASARPEAPAQSAPKMRPGAEPSGMRRTKAAEGLRTTSSDGGSPETERAMSSDSPGRHELDQTRGSVRLGRRVTAGLTSPVNGAPSVSPEAPNPPSAPHHPGAAAIESVAAPGPSLTSKPADGTPSPSAGLPTCRACGGELVPWPLEPRYYQHAQAPRSVHYPDPMKARPSASSTRNGRVGEADATPSASPAGGYSGVLLEAERALDPSPA